MKKFQVWYKTNPNFLAVRKTVDLDEYTLVATVKAESTEEVFREMNAVDGTELCCKLRVRSMSVGDVLVEDQSDGLGQGWACDPVGWKQVIAF